MPVNAVIAAPDVSVIYELPIALHDEKLRRADRRAAQHLVAPAGPLAWQRIVDAMKRPPHGTVSIALVGKYVHLRDSYKSLHEALVHGGARQRREASRSPTSTARTSTARTSPRAWAASTPILVPGGFGGRGAEGKIQAIRYARERGVPFFGICLGLQMAVMEYARNICGLTGANSAEFNPDAQYLVVDLMPDQRGVKDKGGTMRLGAFPCTIARGSLAHRLYGADEISERHRHRYEVNNAYRQRLEADGLVLSGLSPDKHLVEMVELPNHPYFVGCQFHPEFKSKQRDTHEGARTGSSPSASVEA